MSANDQTLSPVKEKQFNTLIKCYEDKDYKKGVKTANAILKDFPKNAKTLCMKHLIVYLMDKNKEEAEKAIKDALHLDPRNGTCWQTLGLFYRHCKNYEEARKAFSLASMRDSSNLQIFIDLASLCAQTRDLAGYRKCFQKLVSQLSGRGNYWVGLIVGYYREGNYAKCLEAIDVYRSTLESPASYLRQELLFLEAECYSRQNNAIKAIKTLEKGMGEVLNEYVAKEKLAVLLGKQGQFTDGDVSRDGLEESKAIWLDLINHNAENYLYYRGLECCELHDFSSFDSLTNLQLPCTTLSLSEDQHIALRQLYDSLAEKFPRSRVIRYTRLALADQTTFASLCDAVVIESVRKGMPSLFRSLRELLSRDSWKMDAFREIVTQHLETLRSTGHLKGCEEVEEPPTEIWLLYLLTELEDHSHHTESALKWLEEALQHTPTCYDLYVLKAKVLKHAGALKEAAKVMGIGSSLDRGDRFMNSKHAKYLLRAGEIKEADKVSGYWTKRNVMPRVDLREMQACWYEVECGASHERKGDVVHANKMYHNIITHFDTYVLDQFDFHHYVLRKATVSTYLQFLTYVDHIYNHPYYHKAAAGYLRCAVQLAKGPIEKRAYLKRFGSVVVRMKGKPEEDSKDPDVDGFTLAANPKPLDAALPVAKRLLEVGKESMECMEAVLQFAVAAKNQEMAVKAWQHMKAMSSVAGCAGAVRLREEGMACEEVEEPKEDDSKVKTLMYYAEWKGMEGCSDVESRIEKVKEGSLEEFGECYKVLKQIGVAEGSLQQLVAKAKEQYIYFEDYVDAMGY